MTEAQPSALVATLRGRAPRCPYTEQECTDRAAAMLGIVAHTGVAAVGVCVARQRVVWASGQVEGPVSAWMSQSLRPGTTGAEMFPGFTSALAARATPYRSASGAKRRALSGSSAGRPIFARLSGRCWST